MYTIVYCYITGFAIGYLLPDGTYKSLNRG